MSEIAAEYKGSLLERLSKDFSESSQIYLMELFASCRLSEVIEQKKFFIQSWKCSMSDFPCLMNWSLSCLDASNSWLMAWKFAAASEIY